MAQKGIYNVDYASGTERSIVSAARTAVMTGISQVSDKIDNINMEKLNTKYVEVSWHIGARNTGIGPMNHQSWQGRCYYYDKNEPMTDSYVDGKLYQSLVRVTGYGSIIGLCGINCRHSKHAFLPGISTPVYTEEQLADMNDKENQTKLWKGKEYDTYKAMQHMRAMESLMRHLRKELKLLKAAGLEDDPDYTNMKAKYRGVSQQYSGFAKAMDLQEQKQRVYDDGLGKIINLSEEKALQQSMEYEYNGERGFIPDDATITNIKTIAGRGVETKLRVADKLSEKYGGNSSDWRKRVGKITSDKYVFDIHWYEKDAIMQDIKIKFMKER